jgi:hypothetical protein
MIRRLLASAQASRTLPYGRTSGSQPLLSVASESSVLLFLLRQRSLSVARVSARSYQIVSSRNRIWGNLEQLPSASLWVEELSRILGKIAL